MKKIFTSLFLLLSFFTVIFAQPNGYQTLAGKGLGNLSTASANFYQSSLMDKYDINYLKISLTVTPNSSFVSGACSYKMKALQPIDTFAIEFRDNMTLDSVFINNVSRSFTRNADHIYVAFATPLPVGAMFTSRFVYSGSVINGLGFGTDTSGLTFAATLSESFQAREWFPAKQLLNDKIDSVDTWLTTQAPNMAGSNGLLKAVVPLPGGKVQYQWSTHYPMSYYMPCFAVANYMEYRNYAKPASMNGDSILIQHFIVNNPNYFNKYKSNLDKTALFIEKFSDLFGLYPFAGEKYGHIHGDIGGGMEHQTMSTMNGFSLSLIGHELCHQWFGDNVTCSSWQEIWLNEGFATFGENLLREYFPQFYSTSADQQMLGIHDDIMSSPGGSVYVPASSAYNEGRIFSGRLSYSKGGAVLRNLRFEMQSDTLFFNTLKAYQNQYSGLFANTGNFRAVCEQVCGRSFSEFFNQWIYGEGFPTINVIYGKRGADTLVLHVDETTSMPSVTPLFTGLVEYKITSPQGDTNIVLNQTSNSQDFIIRYSKTPTGVEVDPNNWIINQTGFIVMPLNLLSFNGQIENKQVKLAWTTSQEKLMNHFEVQRSEDGIHFSSIGSVPAGAGSSVNKQYSFVDEEPSVKNFYRLKMLDYRGLYTFSNTIQLNVDRADLSLNYNDASSVLNVKAISVGNEKLEVTITDMSGKALLRKQYALSDTANEFHINLQSFAKGMYIVQAIMQDERKALQIKR